MTAVVSRLACNAIEAYQRHLSPRKGFDCAFRKLHGRKSCSSFGKRAIARLGLMRGLQSLRRRFRRCRLAMSVLEYQSPPPARPGNDAKRRRKSACGSGSDVSSDERLAWCAADAGIATCCSACGR